MVISFSICAGLCCLVLYVLEIAIEQRLKIYGRLWLRSEKKIVQKDKDLVLSGIAYSEFGMH